LLVAICAKGGVGACRLGCELLRGGHPRLLLLLRLQLGCGDGHLHADLLRLLLIDYLLRGLVSEQPCLLWASCPQHVLGLASCLQPGLGLALLQHHALLEGIRYEAVGMLLHGEHCDGRAATKNAGTGMLFGCCR
jgi:hypothetical protein